MTNASTLLCRACGRPIVRKDRHPDSEPRAYCSKRCRSQRVGPRERALEAAILAELGQRARGATICPSEIARRSAAEAGRDDWRSLMEPVRRAGRRLAAQGAVRFLQGGREVDAATARGIVRLGRGGEH